MKNTFLGSLTLTKFKHATIVNKKNKSGVDVPCLLVPIHENFFTYKDGAVYCDIKICVHDEPDKFGQDGFIVHQVNSKTYKEATPEQQEEFKKFPFIGNFKDFSGNSNPSPAQVIEETDDLPWD